MPQRQQIVPNNGFQGLLAMTKYYGQIIDFVNSSENYDLVPVFYMLRSDSNRVKRTT